LNSDYPTVKEFEAYLLDRGERYGFSNIIKAIRTDEFTTDYIGVYKGRNVLIEVKKRIESSNIQKFIYLYERTNREIHVWTLTSTAAVANVEGVRIHVPDMEDLSDWLVDYRDRRDKDPRKGLLTGELNDTASYLERKGFSIISYEIVEAYLQKIPAYQGMTQNGRMERAKMLIHQLSQKGWLSRITQNRYLLIPMRAESTLWSEHPLVMASHIVEPSFVTAGAALNFHGLLDQVFFRIDVATLKGHSPVDFQGVTFNFIKMTKSKFFGYTEVGKGPQPVIVAEAERALIDVLDRLQVLSDVQDPISPFYLGADLLDLKRLIDYTVRLGSHAAVRRLCYLLETYDMVEPLTNLKPRYIDRLEGAIGSYRTLTPFATRGRDDGMKIQRWKILDNVELKDEIELRVRG